MDAWSGDQLRKMQLGGNDALNSFLKKYSVDKFTEIKEKYSTQAAEVRALLRPEKKCQVKNNGHASWEYLRNCPADHFNSTFLFDFRRVLGMG